MSERSTLSRRQALELLLGAPLAAQACRHARPRAYPGRLLGASSQVGHRLRDATLAQAPAEETELGVAIVGAGPSGLSAAWRLERLGYRDFQVFELEPQAGGTSAYGRDGVVPYPWGAHYVPMPSEKNPALVTLLGEVGALSIADGQLVPSERALIREPDERLFIDGSWQAGLFPLAGASAEDLAEMARFEQLIARWVAFRDARGRRAFAVPMRLASDAAEVKELDRISAASLLRAEGFKSARVRWYAEYACRDDYGLDLEHTSAWAFLFYFCARVAEPGGPSQPFLSWPEGNGHLVAHLASVAGERLRTNQLVTDVERDARGVRLAVLDAPSGKMRAYRASAVILAVPKFVVPRVLAAYRAAPPSDLASFQYGSWLVANLHLQRRPSSKGFPFAWDNVLYDSPSLGYVVATHQTLADLGPTIWTYYLPLVGDAPAERRKLEALNRAECVDSIVSDLARAHQGLEDAIERIDVWRWGHAMISPRPGFIWGGARERAAEPLADRIFFAHSDLSGLALFEEAQDR
ncbi:MAG TPA: FAD-dependent oxidoreductase, partial [Polyangiaceae bacterium]